MPYRAVLKRRKGFMSELNAQSFIDSLAYLKEAEAQITMPSLFDLEDISDIDRNLSGISHAEFCRN